MYYLFKRVVGYVIEFAVVHEPPSLSAHGALGEFGAVTLPWIPSAAVNKQLPIRPIGRRILEQGQQRATIQLLHLGGRDGLPDPVHDLSAKHGHDNPAVDAGYNRTVGVCLGPHIDILVAIDDHGVGAGARVGVGRGQGAGGRIDELVAAAVTPLDERRGDRVRTRIGDRPERQEEGRSLGRGRRAGPALRRRPGRALGGAVRRAHDQSP